MYKSSEVAKKALKYATELKEQKKRIRSIIQNGTMLTLFMATLVLTMTVGRGTENIEVVNLESTPIPLAVYREENDITSPECDIEWECENCKEAS
jgi:hypothetical protein